MSKFRDLPTFPPNVRPRAKEVLFNTVMGKWRVVGPATRVIPGKTVIVSKYGGETIEVYITKLVATKQVYHRNTEKLVRYVAADFEHVIEDWE